LAVDLGVKVFLLAVAVKTATTGGSFTLFMVRLTKIYGGLWLTNTTAAYGSA